VSSRIRDEGDQYSGRLAGHAQGEGSPGIRGIVQGLVGLFGLSMSDTNERGQRALIPSREEMEAMIKGAFDRAPELHQAIILKAINSRDDWEDTPKLRDLLAFEAMYNGW